MSNPYNPLFPKIESTYLAYLITNNDIKSSILAVGVALLFAIIVSFTSSRLI